jgi:hypothetical protein
MIMKDRTVVCTALLAAAIFLLVPPGFGQPAAGIPHLQKQGTVTQLIVDGRPFMALAGELGNNTATSVESMQPVWPALVSGNLNCALVAISWAQMEPEQGKFDFALVDALIQDARKHNLKLVFLWFGSWKNGLSSYAPYWVKRDFEKYPRIQLRNGRSMELLSTFGEATRDADARAFRALMRRIREVDGKQHTVLMMQVENEVGVLRDSRDRSAAANKAFAGPVPKELMDYLVKHRDNLIPEFRDLWATNGNRTSGTWEQVFGPGLPENIEMPIQTTSPPMSREEHDTAWRKLNWPVDEIFMAWHYARFVNKIIEEGRAEYPIPMFVNAWLQQPNMAWPGTYPSGGPLPQVHDVWRAGAPTADFLAPDIYIQQFEEACQRWSRSGNPLFIPETSANAANAFLAFVKYAAFGFSPFGIERNVGPATPLAGAYRLLADMAPVILAHQGKNTMALVRMNEGDPPHKISLGNYTLELTYMGARRAPIAPPPPAQADQAAGGPGRGGAAPAAQAPAAGRGMVGGGGQTSTEVLAVFIANGPDEYFMGGTNGLRIAFTPNTPGPPIVGQGDVQVGRFVDGKWTVVRQLGGDDTGQGEILSLRPNTVQRVTVYRYR